MDLADGPSLLEPTDPELVKHVKLGSEVELRVKVKSNPLSTIKWTSPTAPIPVNGNERYDIDTTIVEPDGYADSVRGTTVMSKLVIKSVSRFNDTGQFICNVTNNEGDAGISFTIEVESGRLLRFLFWIHIIFFHEVFWTKREVFLSNLYFY